MRPAVLLFCARSGDRVVSRTDDHQAWARFDECLAARDRCALGDQRDTRFGIHLRYALSMTLTDQDGAVVGLDVFRGTPVFVGMFYATCPSACPMLIWTIKRVMSANDPALRDEVRVLLVSFDPERDRPEVLRAAFAHRGLDAHWKLASAPEEQMRDLAALLGIQYAALGRWQFRPFVERRAAGPFG